MAMAAGVKASHLAMVPVLNLAKPGCVLYTWSHTWGKSSATSSSGSVPLHHRVVQVGPENSPCPALTTPTLLSQIPRSPWKATFLPKDPTQWGAQENTGPCLVGHSGTRN